ncbi:MAG: response regulator [Gemmatimonadetes bacterium]|nr:response regulator [Gemmatimonadota bacterium]
MHLGRGQSLLLQVKRSRTAKLLAVALAVVPVIHPIFRPALGPPSHLLWFVHVFPVAWASYVWGTPGAVLAVFASAAGVLWGEATFGAGYGHGADEATRWALVTAVGMTAALVSGFAQWIRTEERRRAELERLATTALNASLDGILLLDGTARVRYANPAAAKLFEADGGHLLGREVGGLMPDQLIGSAIAGQTPGRWETVAKSGSGVGFPAEIRSSPITGETGTITGWLVTVRDRTQELQHEEADRRSQALSELGTAVAGVAHELNNPLAAVAAYGELLMDHEASVSPEVRESMQAIAHESRRAAGIVRQLLDRVRKRSENRKSLDLSELIEHALQARAPQFAAHSITVVRAHDPSLPAVTGSSGEIEQILANLLANAQQAMYQAHGQGTLRLTSRRHGKWVEVVVEDDGPGIPEANLPRIFDPFFSTKGADGTGLGLAIARRVAGAHGGELTAANRAAGGAAFSLRLPIAGDGREPDGAVPRTSSSLAATAAMSVLLVDDEPAIRKSLGRLLQARGLEITAVAAVGPALDLLERRSFEAVLSDVHLPGASGMDFFRTLTARGNRLAHRFILMTGDVLGPEVAAFIEETGCPYVTKPFELHEVIAQLERVRKLDQDGPVHSGLAHLAH